jgi:hypothetical protein
VIGAEVFLAGASTWVAGCSGDTLGLLVSTLARRVSADVCEWVVVSRTWSLVARHELSIGSSIPSLFLGGISWVFSRAHELWVPMLRSDRWKLPNSNKKRKKGMNEREESDTKSKANGYHSPPHPPSTRCLCGSIYRGRLRVLLQCLTYP